MDISKARCVECDEPMAIRRLECPACDLAMEGRFEISPLGWLPVEDQLFVSAFVRYHGSIKRMESLFDISYPTVKNRLNRIAEQLDAAFVADDVPDFSDSIPPVPPVPPVPPKPPAAAAGSESAEPDHPGTGHPEPDNSDVLDRLARGEISVDEALEAMS